MAEQHDAMADAVAAYVLGSLEPAEAAAVRAHLEGCESCRSLLLRLRSTVAALPLAVDEVAPPPGLRERVLSLTPPPARPVVAARTESARSWWAIVAAAALVAFALGGGLGYGLGTSLERPAPSTAAVVRASMSGTGSLAGAHADVIDLRQDGYTLVDFSGMPAPGQDRVYELWLIPAGGKPIPALVFLPDANGSKLVVVDRSLAGIQTLAVTSEQGPRGVDAPTQQPQMTGAVKAPA
jgi:anti-sigma-K factor RskA